MSRGGPALRLALTVLVLVLSWPTRGGAYENPVLRGMNPDPSVVRVGSDYYAVTSTMTFFPGCPIYHSRDLVNWERIGYALTRPSQFFAAEVHGTPDIFAATLRYHAGTFYLITTEFNTQANFYVTATNPAGPWSDPIVIDHAMFDPSLMFDDDGKVYYTRRGAFKDKDIVQAEIDIKTGKLLTPLRSLGRGMISGDAEGPHLYHINGWYYLCEAEGGARFLHMECIGRSKSAWGPFVRDPGNPWLAQHNAWWYPVKSVGHAELVDTPDGKWWTLYLGTRHAAYDDFDLGRETFLAPVTWRNGWPTVKPQDIYHLTVNEPTPALHPWPADPERDEFNEAKLGLDWFQIGVPTAQEPLYSLTERPGFLRLYGTESKFEAGSAFICRRQTEWKASAVTRMEFAPRAKDEEAGLAVYMSDHFHYEIAETSRGGQPVLVLNKSVGDMQTSTVSAPLTSPSGVWLKIEADAETYTFSYAEQAGQWKILGTGSTKLIAPEVASVWSGACFGIYVQGGAIGGSNPAGRALADFDWFEYHAPTVKFTEAF